MEPATNVFSFASQARPMSDAEYDAERARLRETYGDNKSEMGAKVDQAWAKLFYRSGWTQEQLAKKEGKERSYIARRLCFGRFLHFVSMGTNPDSPLFKILTERRFRKYWEQTSGDERDRFRTVQRMLEENIRLERPAGPKLRPLIVEKFTDGKWHTLQEIARGVECDNPAYVKDIIDKSIFREQPQPKVERKTTSGKTTADKIFYYRFFPQNKTVSSIELAEKLGPIIERLMKEGKKHMATMSPDAVFDQAILLRRFLEEWTK